MTRSTPSPTTNILEAAMEPAGAPGPPTGLFRRHLEEVAVGRRQPFQHSTGRLLLRITAPGERANIRVPRPFSHPLLHGSYRMHPSQPALEEVIVVQLAPLLERIRESFERHPRPP